MTRLPRHHLRLVARIGARHLGIGHGGLQVAAVLAASGLAVGAATLLVVLAVMNGFQLGVIEDILEIGSYHLRVTPPAGAGDSTADRDRLATLLSALPGVSAVVPFAEIPALVSAAPRRGAARSRPLQVRVVPPEVRRLDPGFARHVAVVAGEFALDTSASIVLGAELATHLRVLPGDQVTVVTLSGLAGVTTGAALRPRQERLTVRGIFRSGLYEYDLGWGFVGPSSALAGGADQAAGTPLVYGVKLDHRFRDEATLAAARSALAAAGAGAGAGVESWRTFNRALFAALRVEKQLMVAILGLVFVVVAYNILQGLRRRVVERSAELGLLRALGAPPWAVRGVFIWEGALLGLLGAAAGIALGLLLAHNIGGLFAALEAVANAALALAAWLSGTAGAAAAPVEIFSPATFYLVAVPSRLILTEVLLVAAFTVAAPAFAGLAAATRAGRVAAAAALRAE